MMILFCKAFLGLLVFDLFVGDNFGRLHRVVRSWKVASTGAAPKTVVRVCDAVNHACSWYPKRALCLQRSAVTTCLLRSEGVPAQMVLGAQKLPFKAHAWVEVDGLVVNERAEIQTTYAVWERC